MMLNSSKFFKKFKCFLLCLCLSLSLSRSVGDGGCGGCDCGCGCGCDGCGGASILFSFAPTFNSIGSQLRGWGEQLLACGSSQARRRDWLPWTATLTAEGATLHTYYR
ncbi:hypothetical protein F4809DRAFT_581932 [Biscogniauxia mediterranea]|nr:hypothetical protein F4809DRAFT_581932 [Biscogniauxia mediterranea]